MTKARRKLISRLVDADINLLISIIWIEDTYFSIFLLILVLCARSLCFVRTTVTASWLTDKVLSKWDNPKLTWLTAVYVQILLSILGIWRWRVDLKMCDAIKFWRALANPPNGTHRLFQSTLVHTNETWPEKKYEGAFCLLKFWHSIQL